MLEIIGFVGRYELVVLEVPRVQLVGIIGGVGVEIEQFKISIQRFGFGVSQHAAQRLEFFGSIVNAGGVKKFVRSGDMLTIGIPDKQNNFLFYRLWRDPGAPPKPGTGAGPRKPEPGTGAGPQSRAPEPVPGAGNRSRKPGTGNRSRTGGGGDHPLT